MTDKNERALWGHGVCQFAGTEPSDIFMYIGKNVNGKWHTKEILLHKKFLKDRNQIISFVILLYHMKNQWEWSYLYTWNFQIIESWISSFPYTKCIAMTHFSPWFEFIKHIDGCVRPSQWAPPTLYCDQSNSLVNPFAAHLCNLRVFSFGSQIISSTSTYSLWHNAF